jgi:hypothetical protein
MGELVLIILSIFGLLGLTLLRRRSRGRFRTIPALERLQRLIGLSMEDGTRLHLSIGRGGLLTGRGGVSLAGLSTLRALTERTAVGDKPPVATTGDPVLALLAQDTLQAGYQAAAAEDLYVPTSGRLTGPTPFSYAVGAMPVVREESVSANLLLGGFGAEAALISDAALRSGVPTIGATDEPAAQAILFAGAQEPLIGEELFAAAAYLGTDPAQAASLTLQDILRWLLVLFLLGGTALKLLGSLG